MLIRGPVHSRLVLQTDRLRYLSTVRVLQPFRVSLSRGDRIKRVASYVLSKQTISLDEFLEG